MEIGLSGLPHPVLSWSPYKLISLLPSMSLNIVFSPVSEVPAGFSVYEFCGKLIFN